MNSRVYRLQDQLDNTCSNFLYSDLMILKENFAFWFLYVYNVSPKFLRKVNYVLMLTNTLSGVVSNHLSVEFVTLSR